MHPKNKRFKYRINTSISAQKAYNYLLAATLCVSSLQAIAADWTSISKTNQAEMLVDMDSYNETLDNEMHALPYISTKTLFVQPQNYRKNALKFSYRESRTSSQFNCTEHT